MERKWYEYKGTNIFLNDDQVVEFRQAGFELMPCTAPWATAEEDASLLFEFYCRGKQYVCSLAPDTFGHVIQAGGAHWALPHPTWRIVGFSHHHMCNNITRTLEQIAENPELAVGCYVWDNDHGTTRTWGGMYCGHIPRVTSARVIKETKA